MHHYSVANFHFRWLPDLCGVGILSSELGAPGSEAAVKSVWAASITDMLTLKGSPNKPDTYKDKASLVDQEMTSLGTVLSRPDPLHL